jgi:hypothetical protein
MSLDDALDRLLAQVEPLPRIESVSTFEADGRVLAADLVAALQVPPQDNASMDGYALKASDVSHVGAVLRVTQRVPAGAAPHALEPGTAARIFTGAQIPEGADTVVMQEETEAVGGDFHAVRFHGVPGLASGFAAPARTSPAAPWCCRGASACRPPAWDWRRASVAPGWTWWRARAWRCFQRAMSS